MAAQFHLLKPLVLRLELECDVARVRTAVTRVQTFLKENGCEEDARLDCELAVVEGCNNAIKHSTPQAAREPVLVEVVLKQREIELRITDHGPGFAWPKAVKLPEPQHESGRGLYLIRTLMDHATYLRGAKQNTLVLRKSRSAV